MTQKRSQLAADARKQLFSRVEAMREADKTRPVDIPVPPARKGLTDFSTLPGYDDLRTQIAIGEKAGIENPYYRLHEGRAGAHTEIGGRTVLNFSCYDYLGLNGHPEITAAAKAAKQAAQAKASSQASEFPSPGLSRRPSSQSAAMVARSKKIAAPWAAGRSSQAPLQVKTSSNGV